MFVLNHNFAEGDAFQARFFYAGENGGFVVHVVVGFFSHDGFLVITPHCVFVAVG